MSYFTANNKYLTANNKYLIGYSSLNALELIFDNIISANNIVGDATSVDDWNTAFDSPASPFTSVVVDVNTVMLYGGSNITVPNGLFSTDYDEYGHLVSIIDNTRCIVAAGYNSFGDYNFTSNGTILETSILPALTIAGEACFYYCSSLNLIDLRSLTAIGDFCFEHCVSLISISLPSLITTGNTCFYSCTDLISISLPILIDASEECFYGCSSLTSVNLPVLNTAGNRSFYNCLALNSISLPSLTSAGDSFFSACTALTTISLPVCTSLGTSVLNNNVFLNIVDNSINITIPASLMNCNSGNPDGDIQYLIDPIQGNTINIIISDASIPLYGLLYNWYAIESSILAPIGWHVPSSSEFEILTDFLEGEEVAGGKLKEAGTTNWSEPNEGATNESNFTGLPGGLRCEITESGIFASISIEGYFWTTTVNLDHNGADVLILETASESSNINTDSYLNFGFSFRCIRDTSSGWITGETIFDYDRNKYNTVQIGTQIWTKQNLAVTHYNNGTIIPEVTDASLWCDLSTGALCAYDNDWSYVFV